MISELIPRMGISGLEKVGEIRQERDRKQKASSSSRAAPRAVGAQSSCRALEGSEEQDRLSSNSVIVGAELPPGVVLLRGIPQAKRWSVCQRPLFPKGHHGQVQGALMADSGLGIVLGLKENCFCFLSVS